MTYNQTAIEMRKNRTKNQLCVDLSQLIYHDSYMIKVRGERTYAYFGEPCTSRCFACTGGPFLHHNCSRYKYKGYQCFLPYHNISCFDLAKSDQTRLLGK